MRRVLVVGAVAAALLIGACGSSGGSSAGAAGPITKADYLRRGNALCQKLADHLKSAAKDVGASGADGIATYLKGTLVPAVRAQLDDLRALGYPAGDDATLKSIYDDAGKVLDSIAQNPSKFVTESSEDPFASVNKRLSHYGLTKCGSN